MVAQRLLEGEAYVAVSLIPYMICKIWKDFQLAITSEESSHHLVINSGKMHQKMIELLRSGDEGTVTNEHHTEGVRCPLKGIPLLVLMASLFDPRMKGGAGIPK